MKNEMIGFATCNEGTYGGRGGEEVTVRSAKELKEALADDSPRIVYVEGTMNMDELFVASPGVVIRVGSYKTIIGLGDDAQIIRGGLVVNNKTQIIIRNISFLNAISYAEGERPNGEGGIIYAPNRLNPGDFTEIDSINVSNSTYLWIDGNLFSDYPWIAAEVPKGENRHDGLVDIKRASNYITVSNNIFTDHNKTSLIGHDDNNAGQDEGKLKITFYANWFKGTMQRNARVRFGELHFLNNYYSDITGYGIGAGAGSKIIAQNNYFEFTPRSWGHPDGVPSPMGYLLPIDNILIDSSYDQGETGKYQEVPSCGVNWNPADYYSFSPLASKDVKDYVTSHAGVSRAKK